MIETMREDKKEFKWTHGADKSFEALKHKVPDLFWLYLILTRYFKWNVIQVVMQLELY